MKKYGFTLAEVLIALIVIGIIAAITVPAVIQNTQKQEFVTALKKTYSTLSQVTNQIIAEEGSPKADENGGTWMTDIDALYNIFKKYLNNADECSEQTKCFMRNYKFLHGGSGGALRADDTKKLVLADGVQILFRSIDNQCKTGGWGTNDDTCAAIYADINGEKGPNTMGRDMFIFVLKETGLYPAGCDDKLYCSNSKLNENTNKGFGCACKVLREGKMNY